MPHQEEEEVRVGPPPGDDQDRPPVLLVATPSGPGVATRSTGHSGWTLATLLGPLRRLLARPWSRTPLLSSTLRPSVSGMSPTMLNLSPERRERASTQSCRRPARLRSLFLISSRLAVSSPPSPPGLASAAGVTDTSLRARSWSSTRGRSSQRRANKCDLVRLR